MIMKIFFVVVWGSMAAVSIGLGHQLEHEAHRLRRIELGIATISPYQPLAAQNTQQQRLMARLQAMQPAPVYARANPYLANLK